ncbi:MAG: YbaB/EbfC family nucleoid-associated protein [Candidatus Methylacidiphilales bacterium]
MNIAKMMKQAQKMQADMQKIQEDLAQRSYTAECAGGKIRAVAGGDGELKSITIHPDLIRDAANDAEMLEDLILTAVRQAVDMGKDEAQKEMGKLTSGLGIPGLG